MASSSAGSRSLFEDYDHQYMSSLRIVLMGKNATENSRVGNSILGTAAFDSEAPSFLEQPIQKISGEVEKRHITVVNSLQSDLSPHQITQGVRECLSQSAPGPHVIALVLQYNDFNEEDRHRVKTALNRFSEKAIKHTIVLTTDEETRAARWTSMVMNNAVRNLIKECGGIHFDVRNQGWRSEMIRRIEDILKEEHEEEFLICDMYEDGGDGTSVDEDPSKSEGSVRGDDKEEEDPELNDRAKTGSVGGVGARGPIPESIHQNRTTSGKTKLNFVLCGYNTTLKNSVCKMFQGTINKLLPQKEKSNVCVKNKEKIHGRQITIIELPALTRLSEEEVKRETLRCLILCDPGVHLFILVTPVGSLTNEDEAEMEKIKRIFNSPEHFMVLFTAELTTNKNVSDFVLSTEAQSIVSLYASWYNVMRLKDNKNSIQISDLFRYIDNMNTEPYSLQMFMRAQEKRVRHELEEKLSVRDQEIKELQEKIKTPVPEAVRLNLALCGSDRRLTSFISNLILNQSERRSELSSECMRRDLELHGRLISLVELPALFNTQLSEEEVMRQTLRCVSLCDPGVHVFIIIIPDAPLNNEDRAEMEKIQRIFSSRINKHSMILIFQNPEHQTAELDEEKQSVIESFGGRHLFIGPNTQVSMLIEKLEQMIEANRGVCFSTETLWDAQIGKLRKFEEMKKKIHSLETWFQSHDSRERADDLRIVLLGKTGVGKSATGNTILGREAYISDTSQKSVTKECKRESSEINGRHITVIDTPGLFDTELTNEKIQREITNSISMILPGPHVFLLLIPVGRFTQEEATSVKLIQETFGENSLMYTMVLFTRGDDLKNKTIEQWLGNPEPALKNLINECGNRYHVFNNNLTGDRTQVSDLLKKIDDMVKENGDSYYSCKMFREMERKIQEQQMKIQIQRMEQLEKEKEELMNKHEEEKKRIKMTMEDEIQNQRKRREEEFREREDRYKRDIKDIEDQERKIQKELKREREEWERQKQQERQRRHREREDLQSKHEEERGRMKMMMKEERKNHDKERKRREKEFREREEQYKRDIKDIEDQERAMREEMKREREEWEKQKQEDGQSEEETQNTDTDDEESPPDQECLRILLFGRTGNGKSATGNTILGIDDFHSEDVKMLVTDTCQKEDGEVDGKSVTVVDTPGLFEMTQIKKDQVVEELMKSVSLSAPGPHVFIIVVSLGRIAYEKQDTLDMIKKIFGSEAAEFSIVLFTRGDELKEGQTIQQYVETSTNADLKTMITDCGNRFLAFNNTDTQDWTQVTELINMIEELKKSNEGQYFTNEMFEEAAISNEQRRETIEENKREKQAQVEKLQARYDMEIKRMIERLEEKKRKADEETVRLKNKFREKQETLRIQFEGKEKSEQKKREEEDQKRSEEDKQQRDEYYQRLEEMKREIENQNEKQEKEREERERKYRHDQEKMKSEQEHIVAELRRKQEEEIKQRDSEEQMRKEQEEEEREEWKRKIKEAGNDKEIKEDMKQQQREWEEEKKRQMNEREEEEREIKERHEEQLRDKQEELEKMIERLHAEREEEQQMIEEEREKQISEREEKEREYEEERNEMKSRYEELKQERKEEWRRRKQEDEDRRVEKRKRWEKMMEDLKRDQEEEIKRREREERERIEREERECDEMKQKHEEEIEKMKKKHQDEARNQEEELNDFMERKDQHVQEFKEKLEKLYDEKRKQEKRLCHVM